MRWKATGLIVLTTFLVLIMGFTWQINEFQRTSADIVQLGEKKVIQPKSVETSEAILSLTDNLEQVKVGEKISYTISYSAKIELKGVRIIAVLGKTKKEISPDFAWSLGDLKKGTSGSISLPVTILSGEELAISRVMLSQIKKPTWWGKERREILATVDDINLVK